MIYRFFKGKRPGICFRGKAGNGWQWLAMGGNGWQWTAMDGNDG